MASANQVFTRHPRTYARFNEKIREHSYAKMIIESYDKLSKSQAIGYLQKASSTESKLSLLDALKDKITFSTEEIDELLPSTDSSSFNATNVSSFDNLSHLSLFMPQQQYPHILTSFNNAARSTRMSANKNKRSSLLRGLFGRPSSKKGTVIVKQSLKTLPYDNKKRFITVGDQVKHSSMKLTDIEPSYYPKHPYDINTNQKSTNNEIQFSFPGLRYDFQAIKSTTSMNSSIIVPSPKDNPQPIPFTSHSSIVQDKSLSSLTDPISMRQHTKEEKQSAHNIVGIPKIPSMNTTIEKIAFNPHQHKYHAQTPSYHYPKRLSAIETLAKKYSSVVTPRNSTGLFWFNANQPTKIQFPKYDRLSKERNRSSSSSDSRDTSTSSATSDSTKSTTKNTSSSSSSTSTSKKTSSTSTVSSSHSKLQTIKTIGHYNRNQNDQNDLIQIDLNSITSRTSTSTSSTSLQCCHRHSNSRKQLSTIVSTTTASSNDTSPISINNNNNPINHIKKLTSNIPLTNNPFYSIHKQTMGKFKVKRQRIESNMTT